MTSKKTQQIFVFIGKVLHLHHVLQQKEKKSSYGNIVCNIFLLLLFLLLL